MIVAVLLLVWVPLAALVFFLALRRARVRPSCVVQLIDLEDLGPDFSPDRAPDYVGHEFCCEQCGHHAWLDQGSCPNASVRGRCGCGTVYELIP